MDFMGVRQGFSGQDDDANQIINGTPRPSAFLPSSSPASHSSSPSHRICPHDYRDDLHRRAHQEFSWGWAAAAATHHQQGGATGQGWGRNGVGQSEDEHRPDRDEGGGESPEGGGSGGVVVVQRREHMFDKVVTPSDVGKLNRLVIPKQHAERYFPLDSTANEKGLLLNFEDRGGKPWRFRYSYWNSSQSYVMTKGWSRFVKEKRLDAGDIVSFHRGVGEASKHRLYIDWRRRPDYAPGPSAAAFPHHPYITNNNFTPFASSFSSSSASYLPPRPLWNSAASMMNTPFFLAAPATTPSGVWDHTPRTGHSSYYASCGAGGGSRSTGWYGYDDSLARAYQQVMNYMRSGETLRPQAQSQEQEQAQAQAEGGEELMSLLPLVQGTHSTTGAAGKRLRLFGVNMDCASSSQSSDQDEEFDPESPSISNTAAAVHANGYHHHHLSQFPSMSTSSSVTAAGTTMEMDSPPLHIPLHLSLFDDATPVLHLNKSKAPASSSTLDLDV